MVKLLNTIKSQILILFTPEAKSLFRKNSLLFLLIPLLLLIPLVKGDGSEESNWSQQKEDLLKALADGDSNFLMNLNFSDFSDKELDLLGEEVPYFLSFHYEALQMGDHKKRLLEYSYHRGYSDPNYSVWAELSLTELIAQALVEERYKDAEDLALSGWERNPENQFFLMTLLDLLFQRGEITRVLEIIEKAGVLNLLNNETDPDWEFLLLYALASHQLERSDWKEPFIRIINFCPQQEILVKAYEYLQNQGEIILSEDEPVAFLARGRYHYAKNEYSLALKYLSEIDLPYFSLLLRELAGSYSGAGRSREGTEYLLSLLPRVKEEEISILLAEAGFLYRRAGFYRDAVDVFSRAWGLTTDVSIKDRMAWYSLDCSMKISIFEGAKALQKWQKQWNNPSYFNDLLEAYAERLIREGGWKTLESIYKEGSSFWDPAAVSKYSFLLARGYSQGFLVPETPQKEEELLRMVMLEDAAPYYYKILAAYLLKERIGRDFFVLDKNPLSSPETQNGLTLVEGFLSYSLPLRSYALMMENLAFYPEDLIHRTISACRDKGYYYESLRLAYRAFHRGKITPSAENIPLLYPLAFSKEIEKAAATEDLSLPLILALVREESFFSPTIVSRSGAVGLCQIMPLTAADISKRLGLKTYSLEDPSDNLTLGAWYLGSQFRRFNSLVPALWAYNAGPTRAREWLKVWGTLDPFLLPEIAPYPETKEYVKKILVSSVFYSLIYNLDSPERILNNFFPGGV